MPASPEAGASTLVGTSSPTTSAPSLLDPRFQLNQALQFFQEGEVRAYGFSYLEATSGRQVTEWVFKPSYNPPPAILATAEAPTDPAHDFQSLGAWKAALTSTEPGAIWESGCTFSRSWVSTYRGVPSADASYYAAHQKWPPVPTVAVTSSAIQQVDPGSCHVPTGAPPTPNQPGESLKAALRVVTAAQAGHPEYGDTEAYTVEFWGLFSAYVQPNAAALPITPGVPPGLPEQTLAEYLAYWHGAAAPDAPTALSAVCCSRTSVNPYVG